MLIAEFCQNHNGSFAVLREMIAAAADSGATHAKIQTIFADDLSYRLEFEGLSETPANQSFLVRPWAAEYRRLHSLELSVAEQAEFVVECEKRGLTPMTTAFNLTTIPMIREIGIQTIKIASYDCASLPLVEAAAEYFNHVVLSTGASYNHEIEAAASLLAAMKKEFTLLHCVTIYPTPLTQMHLSRMSYLKQFTSNVGLSSHPGAAELGISADLIALSAGAAAIERHFTVLPREETRDGKVSTTPRELRKIREFMDLRVQQKSDSLGVTAEEVTIAMGDEHRQLSEIELQNRHYYRGRFINRTTAGPIVNWDSSVRELTGI